MTIINSKLHLKKRGNLTKLKRKLANMWHCKILKRRQKKGTNYGKRGDIKCQTN